MKQRPDSEKKINEVLDSLDGIRPAEPPPYFYTRVMARLQRDEATGWSMVGSFLGKPAIAIVGLCMILVMNVFMLLRQDNAKTDTSSPVTAGNVFGLGNTDNDYIIASSSSFDYENIDQQ